MTKNPLINAATAGLYIGLIVSFMTLAERYLSDKPDTLAAPLAMLSLLTLSASVMALVFFYQPVTLIAKGEHKEAFNLLAKTIGWFAVITIIFVAILFASALL